METRTARKIPKPDKVKYNEVVTIPLAFMFCDIKGYTKLVDNSNNKTNHFSTESGKTALSTTTK